VRSSSTLVNLTITHDETHVHIFLTSKEELSCLSNNTKQMKIIFTIKDFNDQFLPLLAIGMVKSKIFNNHGANKAWCIAKAKKWPLLILTTSPLVAVCKRLNCLPSFNPHQVLPAWGMERLKSAIFQSSPQTFPQRRSKEAKTKTSS
jgi:hypothetical protein